MNTASADDRWVRSDRVLSRTVPDGVLLLSMDRGDPLVLTGPGAILWDLLAEPTGLEEAAQILAEMHEVDTGVVRSDIAPVLQELDRLGLIRRSGQSKDEG